LQSGANRRIIPALLADWPVISKGMRIMIGSILAGKGSVVTVRPDTPFSEIVALLHQHRIGAVLVMDGERIAGLVSERDICRRLHQHGRALLDCVAFDIMTSPVVSASPRISVAQALAIMTERRFRHLPVVDDGRLLGVVSIGDLVKQRIAEAEAEAESLKQYIAS
jgi:CBS domain-containing protein